jgi:hypothetical protein
VRALEEQLRNTNRERETPPRPAAKKRTAAAKKRRGRGKR